MFIICAHCGKKVLPRTDGSCPSCQQAAGTESAPRLTEREIARGLAQQADVAEEQAIAQGKRRRRTLGLSMIAAGVLATVGSYMLAGPGEMYVAFTGLIGAGIWVLLR